MKDVRSGFPNSHNCQVDLVTHPYFQPGRQTLNPLNKLVNETVHITESSPKFGRETLSQWINWKKVKKVSDLSLGPLHAHVPTCTDTHIYRTTTCSGTHTQIHHTQTYMWIMLKINRKMYLRHLFLLHLFPLTKKEMKILSTLVSWYRFFSMIMINDWLVSNIYPTLHYSSTLLVVKSYKEEKSEPFLLPYHYWRT